MGRPGKEARRAERARESVERGIARNSAIGALEDWSGLSREDRFELAPRVARLLDEALFASAQDDRAVVALAVCADRADDLLSTGDEAQRRERWWRLTWACLRQNDL